MTSIRASRRRVTPCAGWSYPSHLAVTAALVLFLFILMSLGGA